MPAIFMNLPLPETMNNIGTAIRASEYARSRMISSAYPGETSA
jgi:hypothetical protein